MLGRNSICTPHYWAKLSLLLLFFSNLLVCLFFFPCKCQIERERGRKKERGSEWLLLSLLNYPDWPAHYSNKSSLVFFFHLQLFTLVLLFSSNNFEYNYMYIFWLFSLPVQLITLTKLLSPYLFIIISLSYELYEPVSKTHHQASVTNTTYDINSNFHPLSFFPHLRCFGIICRHSNFPCGRKSRCGNAEIKRSSVLWVIGTCHRHMYMADQFAVADLRFYIQLS